MKQLDTYLDLCTQVYDLSKPTPPKDAYAFYRTYVEQVGGNILEPMCGTGRFLIPQLEEGFKIEGFDASPQMLSALTTKANKLDLKPTVWQGYVENFKTDKKYDLIYIPSGSFGLIIDPKAVSETLEILYASLNDGGIFVFEGVTLKAIPNQFGIPRSSLYRRDDDSMIIASFFDLPPQGNVGTTICRYELVQKNEIIKTEIEDFKLRLYDPSDLTEELKSVGFSTVRLVKAFDRSRLPDENDEVIVFECTK